MNIFTRLILIQLFIYNIFVVNSTTAQQQDSPDCCAWIYSTGRFMGWADALLEYTRPREAPSPFDLIIYEQLQEASVAVERAANSCAPHIPAWTSWRQKQSYLAYQLKELQNTTNHKFKRGRVYTQINSTYNSWANELSIMMYNGEVLNNTTCATCYFRLGFSTAYASQAFRQAEEALVRNNDEKEAKRQMKLASGYLTRTKKVLITYDEIQQPSGSFIIRCANLNNLDLENRISSLIRNSASPNNVKDCIRQANSISDDIMEAVSRDCIFNSNQQNNQSNDDDNNSYEYCRSKYCPECDNSIILLDVAADEKCQECLDKKKDLIFQCMNGNSNSNTADNEINFNLTPIPTTNPPEESSRTPPDINSLLSQADCANVQGAVAEWNPVSEQVICSCVDPYHTWDPAQKKCVPNVQAILDNSDCSQWLNTEPKWDYSSNEPYCDCMAGYEWNEDFTQCLSKQDIQVAQTDCSQYPNTQPIWDPVNEEVICDCLPGYEWDENYTKCISKSLAVLQNTDCSGYPNTEAVWNPVSQQAYCDCLPGYQWNEDYTACEKLIQQQQQQQPQFDCSHLPNSRPVFDPVLNEKVCDCMPGYQWNRNQTACVPIPKKPTVDWGSILNMTMDIMNVVNGNNPAMPTGYPSGSGNTINSAMNQQQPVRHQSNCNDQQQAGANTPEEHTIDLGQSFGSFMFDYQTFTEEDQIIITNGGRTIFNSGCVGEKKSVRLNLSGFSPVITVRVNPNCDGGTSTQWNFT
ncbi:MAG: hypothetical protein ABFS16_16950, partial [Bacteroidota bacterium]